MIGKIVGNLWKLISNAQLAVMICYGPSRYAFGIWNICMTNTKKNSAILMHLYLFYGVLLRAMFIGNHPIYKLSALIKVDECQRWVKYKAPFKSWSISAAFTC